MDDRRMVGGWVKKRNEEGKNEKLMDERKRNGRKR